MLSACRNIFLQITERSQSGSLSVLLGLFLAAVWQFYKRIVGLPVLIQTYKGTFFLIRPKCATSSRFIYERKPDEDNVNILARFADKNTSFVDIGGNVGLYTVLLCRDFSDGWLFEPNPVAASMARQNIALNSASKRFEVIEAAAGDENGTVQIPVLDIPLTTARIGVAQHVPAHQVPIFRLDQFLPKNRNLVVKTDTEGFDGKVIKGLNDLFAKRKIKICLFECLTEEILQAAQAVKQKYDYEIIDGRYRVYQVKTRYEKPHGDLFLVRRDLLSHNPYKK